MKGVRVAMSVMNRLRSVVALAILLLVPVFVHGTTPEEAAKSYFEEGKELSKQQRYDEGLVKLTLAVQASLETHKYHQALFMTYMALRRGVQAIDVYKKMAGEHPDSPTVHYWLGRLYLQSQSLDAAALEFRKAAELAPKDDHAWISLGHTYYRQGKDAEAMAAYQTANKLSPKVAAVHAGLGSLYLKRSDYPKAQRELETALRLDPSLTEARFDLSLIYERQGEIAKAVKEWRRILDDDPNESAARERLARTYFEQQQYEDAVREYSTLSQVRQGAPEVFFALGEAQVMLAASLTDSDDKHQLKDLALQAFQRTLELDPNHARARRYLDILSSKNTPGQVPQ
jgi:tetratricopeptide (TPR) repeat protein